LERFCADDQEFPALISGFYDSVVEAFILLGSSSSSSSSFPVRSSTISLEASFVTLFLWGRIEKFVLVLWSGTFDLKHIFEGKI